MTQPVVQSGQILCLRLFDVGEDIDLERAEQLLEKTAGVACNRRASRMEDIALPLRLELGKRDLEIIEIRQPIETSVSMHLYDSGSISVMFTIDILEGTPLGAIIPRCTALYASRDLETLARDELTRLLPVFLPAVGGVHHWHGFETYTIVRVFELADELTPDQLLAWPDLGKLLVGEVSDRALRKQHREEVLEYTFGYLDDDLTIVDWNSAFLLDPRRDPTIVEILEFANCHLLNLRYYDSLLEAETKRIYGELSDKHGIFDTRYSKLAQDVLKRVVALGEISDRVENTTKVVGEYYTARVYRAAVARLRVQSWSQSIERKQRLVAEAYGMLKGEVELRRTLLIEVAIVSLIVLEVILAILPGVH